LARDRLPAPELVLRAAARRAAAVFAGFILHSWLPDPGSGGIILVGERVARCSGTGLHLLSRPPLPLKLDSDVSRTPFGQGSSGHWRFAMQARDYIGKRGETIFAFL